MTDAKEILTHLDDKGRARMVDVGGKKPAHRTAVAEAIVDLGPEIAPLVRETGGVAKGNVIETARIAGIMAAKKTAELIPMCHPLGLDVAAIDARFEGDSLILTATASCTGPTGVEMEAMTAVSVAALTVYDMCKAAGKGIVIRQTRLLEKTGGKSGIWRADDYQGKE